MELIENHLGIFFSVEKFICEWLIEEWNGFSWILMLLRRFMIRFRSIGVSTLLKNVYYKGFPFLFLNCHETIHVKRDFTLVLPLPHDKKQRRLHPNEYSDGSPFRNAQNRVFDHSLGMPDDSSHVPYKDANSK